MARIRLFFPPLEHSALCINFLMFRFHTWYLSNTLVNMIFRMAGRIFLMSMQTEFFNSPQQEISNVYQGLIAQANTPTDWLVTCKGVEVKLRARHLVFSSLGEGKKKRQL